MVSSSKITLLALVFSMAMGIFSTTSPMASGNNDVFQNNQLKLAIGAISGLSAGMLIKILSQMPFTPFEKYSPLQTSCLVGLTGISACMLGYKFPELALGTMLGTMASIVCGFLIETIGEKLIPKREVPELFPRWWNLWDLLPLLPQ